MKLRKGWLMVIKIGLMVSLVAIYIGNKTSAHNENNLEKLVNTVSAQGGTTIEWSQYAREMIDDSSMLQLETQLKQLFPEWKWMSQAKGNTNSLVGQLNNEKFSETIQLVSAEQTEGVTSYILYEAKGTGWTGSIANKLDKVFHSRAHELFDREPVIFSCIKGEFNMEYEQFIQQSSQDLLHSFQADEKESIKEKDFRSISAYSSLFLQNLTLNDNEMNLQVALRKNKAGGTSFVIGTPILTIEY